MEWKRVEAEDDPYNVGRWIGLMINSISSICSHRFLWSTDSGYNILGAMHHEALSGGGIRWWTKHNSIGALL